MRWAERRDRDHRCGTCEAGEAWDEVGARVQQGTPCQGYVCHHQKDTESDVDDGGLYLSYGASEEGEEPAFAVAREAVEELNQQGLKPRWSGSWDRRICVALDWRRRRD